MNEKKHKFVNLLKRKQQISKKNKNNVKMISTNDPQLIDVLQNFNETEDYKHKYMKEM